MKTHGFYFSFALFCCLFLLLPQVAKAAAPPDDVLAPKWAISPETKPSESPYVWPIVNYKLRSRKRIEITNTSVREPRFHAKAPLHSWDPSWRVGGRAYFYEYADDRLNLVGHGVIKKVIRRRDHVRVEASVDSFLYARAIIRRLRHDRQYKSHYKYIKRQKVIDRRRPWNQRWFMSMAMQ